jgi:hypothetical protein
MSFLRFAPKQVGKICPTSGGWAASNLKRFTSTSRRYHRANKSDQNPFFGVTESVKIKNPDLLLHLTPAMRGTVL